MAFDVSDLIAVDTLAGPGAGDGVVMRSDLLPPSTHGSNLRGLLRRQVWDGLRRPVCDAADNQCEICGHRTVRGDRHGRPDCHEKWLFEFRADRAVQVLQRLVALCPGCHEVQHSGRARMRGATDQVIARLCRLNGWTFQQANRDLDRSVNRCMAIDRFAWDLDLSVLNGQLVIEEYPTLYIPAGDRSVLGNSHTGSTPGVQSRLI